MKQKKDLKILLVQMRKDDLTRGEELMEFVRFSGLEKSQFTCLDLFATPDFVPTILDEYDAFFMGGSSDDPEDQVLLDPDIYPFSKNLDDLLLYAADKGIPSFLSCMGFEVGVSALGGRVIIDMEGKETDTMPIFISDEGKKDPVYAGIPDPFMAISFHKKRADKLPPGAITLAYTEKCPIHSFKLDGKPFYAFQFHPEIDRPDLVLRLERYRDRGYTKNNKEMDDIIASLKEVPDANKLVKNFVDGVLLAS